MTARPDPVRLTVDQFLPLAVTGEYRDRQRRHGMTPATDPLPDCPVCAQPLGAITTGVVPDRVSDTQRLTFRPCGHRATVSGDVLAEAHHQARQIVDGDTEFAELVDAAAPERPRITTTSGVPDEALIHLPEYTYWDSQAGACEIGVPVELLSGLRDAIDAHLAGRRPGRPEHATCGEECASLATPAELERRQRYAWHTAGLCPMCGHEDGQGWLCDDCTATVRHMKPRDRRPWRRFEQSATGTPIQGGGYTPAELLGATSDEPERACGEECAEGHVYAGRCAQAHSCDNCEGIDPDTCLSNPARTTPDNPATSGNGTDNLHPDAAFAALVQDGQQYADQGQATVTIAVRAPDQPHAARWAQIIADLVRYEQGDQMRLDIRVTGGEVQASGPNLEFAAPNASELEPDDGLREQYAAAVREKVWIRLGPNVVHVAQEGGIVPLNFGEADAAADAVLAVRDRRMEQLAAGSETARATAAEIEADRDRIAGELSAETALRRERSDLYDLWRAKANDLGRRAEKAEAETAKWLAFIERGFTTHMQFGVINPDGTVEMLPCADWCYACRVERAEAEAARLDAALRTVHSELNKLDAECVYGTHFAQGVRHAVDRIRPHLPNPTQEPTP